MRNTCLATALAGLLAAAAHTTATAETTPTTIGLPTPRTPEPKDKANASPNIPAWTARPNPFAPLLQPEEPGPPESRTENNPPEPADNPTPTGTPDAHTPEPTALTLGGILFATHLPMAVLNDSLAGVGDIVEDYRVTSIDPDRVVAEKNGERFEMTTRQPRARPCTDQQPKETTAAETRENQSHAAENADASKTPAPEEAKNLRHNERPDPYVGITLPTPRFLATPTRGKEKS